MYVKRQPFLSPTFGEMGAKARPDGNTYGTQVSITAGMQPLVDAVGNVLTDLAAVPRVTGW